MESLEIVYSSQALRIATAKNLVLQVWRDRPTVPNLREVGRTARLLSQQFPSGSAAMSLMLGGIPRSTGEVLTEAANLERDETLFPLGLVRVIMRPGLSGIALRSWLRAGLLFRPQPQRPLLIAGSVGQAARWLAPRLSKGGEEWSASELEELTRALLPTSG